MRWFAKMLARIASVLPFARPLRIACVERLNETADVWCLTVPDAECFSLANGAVVHNCADAVRTLAMGLKEAQPHTSNAIIEQQFPTTRTWVEGAHNTGWMSV
jgi:hypothetical protein